MKNTRAWSERRAWFPLGWLLAAASWSPIGRADDAPSRPAPARPGPTVEEYRDRRRRLMEQVRDADGPDAVLRSAMAMARGEGSGPARPVGPVVVLVGAGGVEGDDARFHQLNDFHYLTGVDEPFAAAILRPDSGEETLYLPPRRPSSERFTGPKLGPGDDAARQTGFARVASSGEFLADLFRALGDPGDGSRAAGGASAVYLTSVRPSARDGGRPAWLARLLEDAAPAARPRDVSPRIHELRKTKSPAEVDLLRQAIAATADAQFEVATTVAPGVGENRLEGLILSRFLAGGASRAGFPSIVGSGKNATVLHYEKNDQPLPAGGLVVVDIGAEVKGYTADITRTYPVDGRFTPRQREVYQLVLDAQAGAASEFRAGVSTIGTLNTWVRDFFRRSPLRAKDESGVEKTMDQFFAHGLGHHLGLDVHDVGDASKPLDVGQVFTIEPGLYIPSEGFGVRIEDDYLVTPGGLEKLSGAIPSEPGEVEKGMARGKTGGDGRP